MRRVTSNHLMYAFRPDARPAVVIEAGDESILETVDARGGSAFNPGDHYVLPPPAGPGRGNPVTGPVAVRGAEAGDIPQSRKRSGRWCTNLPCL